MDALQADEYLRERLSLCVGTSFALIASLILLAALAVGYVLGFGVLHVDNDEAVIGFKLRRILDLIVTFILQVLGGIGALWGVTDALALRPSHHDEWRVVCCILCCFCFTRWFFMQRYGDHRFNNVFAAFLLQVCGGTGAIWAAGEYFGLRVNYPKNCHEPQVGQTGVIMGHITTEVFRGPGDAWAPGYQICENTTVLWVHISYVVFVVFSCRWARFIPTHPTAAFFDLHAATFVTDVLGGAGAVWGCAEVFGPSGYSLRLVWDNTHFGQPSFDFWRLAGLPVLLLSLFRWALTWTERVVETEFVCRMSQQAGYLDMDGMDSDRMSDQGSVMSGMSDRMSSRMNDRMNRMDSDRMGDQMSPIARMSDRMLSGMSDHMSPMSSDGLGFRSFGSPLPRTYR